MAAKLTANPNPVLVDGPVGTGTTTIAWDTDGDFPDRVYLSVNGAAPTLFGGGNAGTRTGTKVQSVKLGNTYAFTLRRVSNDAVLAVRTVTVADLMGKAKDVVRTAEFRTGTRLVDVSFDALTVRNDGDPGIKGAGEFEFEFVAGDAQGSVDFFAPDLEQDISAGDPPVLLDRGISLPSGPRQV